MGDKFEWDENDEESSYKWNRVTRDYRHTQRYLYDGLDVLQEITGRNNRNITAYYRANGQLVAQQEYITPKSKSRNRYRHRPHGRLEYYAHDGLDSIVALTNHRGKLRNQIRYDAYGGLVVGDLNETPYGFTGKRFDVESGLYHFHFRKYDPATGVWTTEDPIRIAGGINLYGYVRNDPVNWVEQHGLEPSRQLPNHKPKPSQKYIPNRIPKTNEIQPTPKQTAPPDILPENYKPKGINNLPGQKIPESENLSKNAKAASGMLKGVKNAIDILTGGTPSSTGAIFIFESQTNYMNKTMEELKGDFSMCEA